MTCKKSFSWLCIIDNKFAVLPMKHDVVSLCKHSVVLSIVLEYLLIIIYSDNVQKCVLEFVNGKVWIYRLSYLEITT